MELANLVALDPKEDQSVTKIAVPIVEAIPVSTKIPLWANHNVLMAARMALWAPTANPYALAKTVPKTDATRRVENAPADADMASTTM